MSEETQPVSSSDQQPQTVSRRISKRWFKRGLLIVLAIVLLPYLYYRTTSSWRQLVLTELPQEGDDAAASPSAQPPVTEQNVQPSLRVAAWNIAHGRGSGASNWKEGGDEKRSRVNEIAALIKTFDADVVVLNEVDFSATWSGGFDQADLIAREAGYSVCLKQTNLDFGFLIGRWYFGNAILSRLPVSEPEVINLTPLAEWESWLVGHKRSLGCTVTLPSGQKVSLVGVHLESRGETIRTIQVDDVARHCGTFANPIIVAGDFNTTPSNFQHAQTGKGGENAFDRFIEQTQFTYDQRDPKSPASMTYSTTDPKIAIDWVMVGPELELKKVEITESLLSDHRPIIATIEFK